MWYCCCTAVCVGVGVGAVVCGSRSGLVLVCVDAGGYVCLTQRVGVQGVSLQYRQRDGVAYVNFFLPEMWS